MATYLELHGIKAEDDFKNLEYKVQVAVVKKAQTLLDGTPNATSGAWASNALKNPRGVAEQIMNYVIAANDSATTTAILGASDSAIQTNVDTAVDALIVGEVTS